MKTVPLTKGHVAIVDDADYARVCKHSWCILIAGGYRNHRYAQANVKIGGEWRRISLHRFIMRAKPGQIVDHVNGDGLDCRRANMRIATRGQNQHNSPKRHGTSRFKGVCWHVKSGKWVAQIMANRQHKYLGLFASEEDAARAYDSAAKELHGEFAKTNF